MKGRNITVVLSKGLILEINKLSLRRTSNCVRVQQFTVGLLNTMEALCSHPEYQVKHKGLLRLLIFGSLPN